MATGVNIEPNTSAEILKAAYDNNGNLSAVTPSTGFEVLNAVYEPDGTGNGRLRISYSGGSAGENYYVTGQTLVGTTLKTSVNNGVDYETELNSLSANTTSQVDFMVEPTTGTTYNIVPNNFYVGEIESVNLFTDAGTLNVTFKNNGTVIGGLDTKAVTTSKTTTAVTSGGTFAVNSSLSFTLDTIVTAEFLYGSVKIK